MNHIKTTNEAIENAGGVPVLARKLSELTDTPYPLMYQRVYKWLGNGVSLDYLRPVSRIGRVAITKLIPNVHE